MSHVKSASIYERVCFTWMRNRHFGNCPRTVAGLPIQVVNDEGHYHAHGGWGRGWLRSEELVRSTSAIQPATSISELAC